MHLVNANIVNVHIPWRHELNPAEMNEVILGLAASQSAHPAWFK